MLQWARYQCVLCSLNESGEQKSAFHPFRELEVGAEGGAMQEMLWS